MYIRTMLNRLMMVRMLGEVMCFCLLLDHALFKHSLGRIFRHSSCSAEKNRTEQQRKEKAQHGRKRAWVWATDCVPRRHICWARMPTSSMSSMFSSFAFVGLTEGGDRSRLVFFAR